MEHWPLTSEYTCTCVYAHTRMNLYPCTVLKSKISGISYIAGLFFACKRIPKGKRKGDRGGRKSMSSRTWKQISDVRGQSLKKYAQALTRTTTNHLNRQKGSFRDEKGRCSGGHGSQHVSLPVSEE